MSVDAHLPRAVPAAGVIAHEVAVVVLGCGDADGVFELRRDGEGAEDLAATVAVGADDAFDRHVFEVRDEAFEGEGMFAMTAPEGEARAFFKADRVRYLTFQWGHVLDLVACAGRGGVADAVFSCVEA